MFGCGAFCENSNSVEELGGPRHCDTSKMQHHQQLQSPNLNSWPRLVFGHLHTMRVWARPNGCLNQMIFQQQLLVLKNNCLNVIK